MFRGDFMFDKYMELLLEYNKMFNLTAITQPDEVRIKHFEDCRAIIDYIPQNASLVDVGSGAGFPGMVIAIARPDVSVTLIDSLNKRVNFLQTVVHELELKNVTCHHLRAEEGGANPCFREKFDIATARAVARLNVLAEYCLPYVKVGGAFLAMKGPNPREEVTDIILKLGGNTPEVFDYSLPPDINHTIVRIEKISITPNNYPRRGKKLGT